MELIKTRSRHLGDTCTTTRRLSSSLHILNSNKSVHLSVLLGLAHLKNTQWECKNHMAMLKVFSRVGEEYIYWTWLWERKTPQRGKRFLFWSFLATGRAACSVVHRCFSSNRPVSEPIPALLSRLKVHYSGDEQWPLLIPSCPLPASPAAPKWLAALFCAVSRRFSWAGEHSGRRRHCRDAALETRSTALHTGCLPSSDSGLRYLKRLLKGVCCSFFRFIISTGTSTMHLALKNIRNKNTQPPRNKKQSTWQMTPTQFSFFIAPLRLSVNLSLVQTTP